jgi:flagellar biogenesis protein FliO
MRTRHLLLSLAIGVWLTALTGLTVADDAFNDPVRGAKAIATPIDRPPLRLARPDANRTSTSTAPGSATAPDLARPERLTSGWWTTAGGLSLVVIAIVVCGRFLRRWLPTAPGLLPAQALETLGRFPVDSRNTIHLVRCGNRILVLSAAGDGLRTLCEIDDGAEVASLMRLCTGNDGTEIGDQLAALAKPTPRIDRSPSRSSAALRLQERLRKSAAKSSAPESVAAASREAPHG